MAAPKATLASIAALAVLVCAIVIAKNIDTFLTSFGGRAEYGVNTKWAGHGSFNNERCWTEPGMGCEDVKLHSASSTAFLACGNPHDRVNFYPPAGRHNPKLDSKYQEYFIKYEMKSNKTTRLNIENWDNDQDLVLHGFDIWKPEGNDSQMSIFAVNHGREGESVLLFSHDLGTGSLHLMEKFTHPLIKTPNQVTAAGPRSFFISNDHYYFSGRLRHLEEKYGPFYWASDVVYCETNKAKLDCRVVTPRWSHAYANGILLVDEGRKLMINDVVAGTTTVYDVHPTTKMLKHRQTIGIGGLPDNLSEVSGSGDLIVAVLPNVSQAGGRMFGDDLVKYEVFIEAAVVRLVKAKNYEPELLYWDDGTLISILTASAYDPEYRRLISGGVFERHFVVCDIDPSNHDPRS